MLENPALREMIGIDLSSLTENEAY